MAWVLSLSLRLVLQTTVGAELYCLDYALGYHSDKQIHSAREAIYFHSFVCSLIRLFVQSFIRHPLGWEPALCQVLPSLSWTTPEELQSPPGVRCLGPHLQSS